MEDADIFAQQELGKTIRNGVRPALLLVDFVNGFLDPDIFGGGNTLEAAQASVRVLAAFRQRDLPVVFTRIVYAEDGSDTGVWCEKAPRLAELTESNPASHVADILATRPGELVIAKTQPSAFFDTPLAAAVRHRGVDSLVVVGATTSGCVRATVVDAISANFRPTVLSDCVGDRAHGPHEASLFDMHQKYANVIPSADLPQLRPPQASASW
ncbi:Maleamate amidohydrolase [Roseovarius sp. THAF9]|uniref:isochorismatase family protein n=1 Tax=Roseovarius sp. THAF9 TaxID=2587847 RepID=UPI0012687326|nr:isochorismatase family protein [Roseovarius sp. THAF9]QFT91689.1 Maleamate amidohydrolase [Roseovarius sp. THAF9]